LEYRDQDWNTGTRAGIKGPELEYWGQGQNTGNIVEYRDQNTGSRARILWNTGTRAGIQGPGPEHWD
jgi:hypothetical protein